MANSWQNCEVGWSLSLMTLVCFSTLLYPFLRRSSKHPSCHIVKCNKLDEYCKWQVRLTSTRRRQMEVAALSTELKKLLQPHLSSEGRVPGSMTSVCMGGGWGCGSLGAPSYHPRFSILPPSWTFTTSWSHRRGFKSKGIKFPLWNFKFQPGWSFLWGEG